MLAGQGTTPMVAEGVMAMSLLKDTEPAKSLDYKRVIHNTADYFLGNNPLNMTWITGLGENSPNQIFQKDSWYSTSGGIRQGVNVYGFWRREYFGPYGWWRTDWPAFTTYPDYDLFPGHERWFSIRTAPLVSEFTIHQNNLISAFVFGALLDSVRAVTHVATPVRDHQNHMMLYPNPTNECVNIYLSKNDLPYKYLIYNSLGQMVEEGTCINSTINFSEKLPGFYIIIVKDAMGMEWVGKMVKH